MLYLTAAVYVLSLCLSFLIPSGGRIYSYGLIIQFASLLIPAAVYMSASGKRLEGKMKIRLFSPAKIVLLLLFAVAVFSFSVLYSALVPSNSNEILSGVKESSEPTFLAVLCLAVLPAFSEELFFRGMLMGELEEHGTLTAVILSSLMFAMYHPNLTNLPLYFFCGVMLSLCVYVTRSLLASFCVHLCYNLAVLLGADKINAFFSLSDNIGFAVLILILVLLISLILIFGECQKTYASYSEDNARSPREGGGGFGAFLVALFSPASVVCIIVFIVSLLI